MMTDKTFEQRARFSMALSDDNVEVTRELMSTSFMKPKYMLQEAVLRAPKICRYLIEEVGVSVHEEYHNSGMPLHAARTVEIAKLLVMNGADPSRMPAGVHRDSYLTPFQHAVSANRLELARYFVLECGEDLAQRTLKGRTLNQLASVHPEMKTLLKSLKTEVVLRTSIGDPDDTLKRPKKHLPSL